MIELAIGYAAGVGSALAAGLAGALHLRRRYHHDAESAVSEMGAAMSASIAAERERRAGPRATAGKGWKRDA